MKIFDLSHPLNNTTPVYPGKEHAIFEALSTLEKDGYRETRLVFDSHLGTHIDAPAHMLKNGNTLDQLPVETFSGKAIVIEIPKKTGLIELDFLLQFKQEFEHTDFVLFKTGWSKFWGQPEYFSGFATLSNLAAEWLVKFNLKGIGFDTISADPVESTDWVNHFIIFKKGMIIIENLIFPEKLIENMGEFYCLPIPYEKADGSPVRAILKL